MSEYNDPWDDPFKPDVVASPRQPSLEKASKKPEKRRGRRAIAVLAGSVIAATGLWIGTANNGSEMPDKPRANAQNTENVPQANFIQGGSLELSSVAQKIGPLPEVVAKNANGIVAIASKNGESSATFGTGFKLDNDSIVTAGHVVKGEKEKDPYNCDYTQVRMSIGKVAATAERSAFRGGEGNDAAQIDIDPLQTPRFAELPSLPLAATPPERGTVVYNISRQSHEEDGPFNDPSEPGAQPPSIFAGVVSSVDETTGTVEIISGIVSAYSQGLNYNIPGGSGSPWMNGDGEVIGVVSGVSTPPIWAFNNNNPDTPIHGLSGNKAIGVTLAAPLTSGKAAELGNLSPGKCNGAVYPG